VPDETYLSEVWTELKMAIIFLFYNGKHICLKRANMVAWFLANIILKLEEEPLLQNIIQEGSCIVVVDVYKRLFLRYLQSSKLYYCRWTCGYRLYVFSLVSLSIDISIENCMMRMRMPHWRSFLFLGCVGFLRILDYYHWRWITFKHVKAFPNM
jgi:hypothetical protein